MRDVGAGLGALVLALYDEVRYDLEDDLRGESLHGVGIPERRPGDGGAKTCGLGLRSDTGM